MKEIIAIIYATFAVAKRKVEKTFRLVQDLNPAPSWLVSSIGRALHWYHRGQGF